MQTEIRGKENFFLSAIQDLIPEFIQILLGGAIYRAKFKEKSVLLVNLFPIKNKIKRPVTAKPKLKIRIRNGYSIGAFFS